MKMLLLLICMIRSVFLNKSRLVMENLALRQQLIVMRRSIYGAVFRNRLKNMNIEEVRIVPRSPWQNAYVERVIGSIRRECLDHVIILNKRHLKKMLSDYLGYYNEDRTHLGIGKDAPSKRPVQHKPERGKLTALPRVGGLHHRYEWKKAA